MHFVWCSIWCSIYYPYIQCPCSFEYPALRFGNDFSIPTCLQYFFVIVTTEISYSSKNTDSIMCLIVMLKFIFSPLSGLHNSPVYVYASQHPHCEIAQSDICPLHHVQMCCLYSLLTVRGICQIRFLRPQTQL